MILTIRDLQIEQSFIELKLSHFKIESVFFSIKLNTPIGIIVVDPLKHHSQAYIGDLDCINSEIIAGLKNNSKIIECACDEPLFNIDIFYHKEEKDLYSLRMSLDLKKILSNQPSFEGPCLQIEVRRNSIEELANFFEEIVIKYEAYEKHFGHYWRN